MRFFVLYANICSNTVRKKLGSDAKNINKKKLDNNHELLKIFNLTLPFL